MLTSIQDDISSFFESHFSSDAVKAFQLQFFTPSQEALQQVPSDGYDRGWGEEWEETGYDEDDGLGYYPDGVKRTLTDEQIKIFRHSELHALERQKEKKEDNRKFAAEQALSAGVDPDNREGSATGAAAPDEAEDGEVQGEEQVQVQVSTANKKKRKRKGKNGSGNGQPKEPKPDLRKRTWDVVEMGLDSLDYD